MALPQLEKAMQLLIYLKYFYIAMYHVYNQNCITCPFLSVPQRTRSISSSLVQATWPIPGSL